MKKFYIFMIALLLVNGACQRSQFATTTRHSCNGKVTYVNHYPTERTKSSGVTVRKSHLKETEAQTNSPAPDRTGAQKTPEPEITKINPTPISGKENLIASTSNEPAIIAINENRGVPDHHLILSDKSQSGFKTSDSVTDTIKSKKPKKDKARVHVARIKFKNGHEETVKIIYQSHDTLKYQLINESDAVRIVMMDKVDTISPDPRKTEKFGLAGFILSIAGFVPIIGLPFAILGLIFGVRSLRRIKRFPEKYKGKGFATASVIIGILAIIFNFIFIIAGVSAAVTSCSHTGMHI